MASPRSTAYGPRLLMCRPTYYTIAYEINPWMSLKRQADSRRALAQWEALHRLLTHRLGARVRLLPPRRGVPDLVFTANAGLLHGRTLIRSNFRFAERRKEEGSIASYFRRAGFRVVTLPRRYGFEGEGDALWMRGRLLFGFRFRSDAPAHEALARLVGAEVLPVELADARFYHLDTCFCPLDNRTALWFPGAFDRYGRRVIEQLVPDLISVTERDARRFACNAVAVGRHLVIQTGISSSLARRIERRRFALHPVELSEFLKAGGSAKCLVLHLNHISK
ncbi:MAG: amidinotransferase [Candidatus Omnitrophica bacterium]|nr:amidinotransferase [Candidatus Omnitrophota bacterium]